MYDQFESITAMRDQAIRIFWKHVDEGPVIVFMRKPDAELLDQLKGACGEASVQWLEVTGPQNAIEVREQAAGKDKGLLILQNE